MSYWLVILIFFWVMFYFNLVLVENFIDLIYYEDYEVNFVKCLNVIKVEWNMLLSREFYVIKYSNGIKVFYDGLFLCKC